jgi:hypothetical protein
MTKKKTGKSLTNRYKKQNGLHHKHSGKYIKVYWPYIPVLFLVLSGIGISVFIFTNKTSSNYASTNVSAQTIIDQTNRLRTVENIQTLNINSQLTTAAQIKANDMAINNYWSRAGSSGQSAFQIVKSTGYSSKQLGENFAYGFTSSNNVFASWANSKSHKVNILNPNFSDVGIGLAYAPDYLNQGPQTIVVAIYGGSAASSSIPITTSHQDLNTNQVILYNKYLTDNRVVVLIISGVVICLVGVFLIIKHGLIIKKWAVSSEELVTKHPLIDLLLIIFILGLASLNQTVGIIG